MSGAARIAALFTVAGAAAAQNPPQVEPGATIRTTVNEVLLDMVVRDRHGRLVKNLKPGDIEILEDGVRQRILSFRQVGSRELRRRPSSGGAAMPGPAAARPLRAVNPICIVFHNLDPVSRSRAIEVVQEFLKNDWQPEDYIGLFLLDDRLKPVHPFTNNRDELMRAIGGAFSGRTMDFALASEALLTANPNEVTITATVDTAAHAADINVRVSGGEISKSVITRADVADGPGARAMRGDRVRERRDFSNIEGMRATDQIITMVNELGGLPGRKSVLLVSTGLMTTGDPDRFQSILANANRLGVTVYALDVRGLDEQSTIQAGKLAMGEVTRVSQTQKTANSSLSEMREKSRQVDNTELAVRSSDAQASLRELAEETGGFLMANTNDFRKPFQRIAEEVDARYEVSYRPVSERYDGRLRKIEVRAVRPDVHVESRTGYFAIPDLGGSPELQPFETAALAVLNARPLPQAFEFHAAAFRFRGETELAFEVPASALGATPEPDLTAEKLHVSVLALVKDASGQIVDKYSVDAPYAIRQADLPRVRAGAVTYTHPLRLPPGRYTVESAVLDREGRRASTNVLPLEIGAPPKQVGLSSLLLVQRVEPAAGQTIASDPLLFQGKRVVPWLATTLGPEAKPYLYFVVYPDRTNPDKPRLEVEFLVGGQVLATQGAALPEPDASGAIPMMVSAATRTGDCELRITARQGSAVATESIRYTIAARPTP